MSFSPLSAGPVDASGRPHLVKLGTVDCDIVETTPFVWQGRVLRCEWFRPGHWANPAKQSCFRLVDQATHAVVGAPFAAGCEFASAYEENGTVYVLGAAQDRTALRMFCSRDLAIWEERSVLANTAYGLFNTSLCRVGPGDYLLMFEIDRPVEEAGVPFTARFLRSTDLRKWELTPPECRYALDRYTAPHCLRYHDGWYYNFYLEALPDGYEQYVVRSRDLVHWESSPLNPVLRASEDDRVVRNPHLPAAQRARIAAARDCNNSDIDFCEYEGQLVITYSWGNQLGTEFLAEAVYHGSLAQFLRGWFPE